MFRELDVQKATRDQTEKLEPGMKTEDSGVCLF